MDISAQGIGGLHKEKAGLSILCFPGLLRWSWDYRNGPATGNRGRNRGLEGRVDLYHGKYAKPIESRTAGKRSACRGTQMVATAFLGPTSACILTCNGNQEQTSKHARAFCAGQLDRSCQNRAGKW